jgi:hypothetical protein
MRGIRIVATLATVFAAVGLSAPCSWASGVSAYNGAFTLDLNVDPSFAIADAMLIGTASNSSSAYMTTGLSFAANTSDSATGGTVYPAPPSAYSFFLIGVDTSASNTLALFTNGTFATTAITGAETFDQYFDINPAALISDLLNGGGASLGQFISAAISDGMGFVPGGQFTVLSWDQPVNGGSGTSIADPAATPLPATWTMLLIGLISFGLFTYRRQAPNTGSAAA